jgi:uncharacterized protein YidB (DUF937 family)
MGLMEDVMGSLDGVSSQHGVSQQSSADLMNAVTSMLGGQATGSQSAGLDGLVNSFGQAGLGSLVNSWVGTGANQAPSVGHIEQGLGAETISQLAKRAGISPEVAASMLAVALPVIVDRLTPKGQVPVQSSLGGLLGGLLGGGGH